MNRRNSLVLLLLALLTLGSRVVAQTQNLRAATASSYIERGNQWFAKGEYARAEADFTHYITLDTAPKPQLADAYGQRGLVRLRQGRAEEAQQDFDQCLKLNPRLRQSLERMIDEVRQQMARNP